MVIRIVTRERVRALLERGLNVTQIAAQLNLSKSTVCYHGRRPGFPIDERCNRRYDWAEVQTFYDRGHTIAECEAEFGFARKTFMDAVGGTDASVVALASGLGRPYRWPFIT